MPFSHVHRACVVAWLLCLAAPAVHGQDAEATPPKAVARFAELIEQCARYERTLRNARWETVMDEPFDKPAEAIWAVAAHGDNRGEARAGKVDGRSVVAFDVPANSPGQLLFGKPVQGGFAVEIVARTDAKLPSDLSIFMTDPGAGRNDVGTGPGFQFGGHHNVKTAIWTGDHRRQFRTIVDTEKHAKIQPGKWHRIRLEVSDGSVRGLVDGVLLGQQPLGADYDPAKPMQPQFYVYGMPAVVDHVTVLALRAGPIDEADDAFREAFGERGLAEIEDDLALLTDLLGDPDYFVREAAQQMLLEAGRMARTPLETIEAEGSLEQQHRARHLLRQIPAPLNTDDNDPRKPQP